MTQLTPNLATLSATKKLIAIGQGTCDRLALLHVFENEPTPILTFLPNPPDDYAEIAPESPLLERVELDVALPPASAIGSMTDNDLYSLMVCGYTDSFDYTHEDLQAVKQIDSEHVDRVVETLV